MFKRLLGDAPPEILNWRLWFCVGIFGFLGAARGLDEGLIGTTTTQPSFRRKFGLDDPTVSPDKEAHLVSTITSMVHLGSIVGACIGFYLTDRIGRLRTTQQLCVLWLVGMSIFLAAASTGSLAMINTGRFIAGLGIGQTTVVAPVYLAETAPQAVRGVCVTIFSGAVYIGIMLGYFSSYGASLHISSRDPAQWVIPNSLHLFMAVAILAVSFFALESPSWLLRRRSEAESLETLVRLRNLPAHHPFIQDEFDHMKLSLAEDKRIGSPDSVGTDQSAGEKKKSWSSRFTILALLRHLVATPANRYRLMVVVFSQLLSQWSGAGTVTVYAPRYFRMLGIESAERQLFATAMFGIIKFISAMLCSFCLVDLIGRKRSLLAGASLQLIGILFIALFLTFNRDIDTLGAAQSASQKRAATAAIAMIYLSGFGWALGWNSIQYLINAEIFPASLRALGGSIAMTLHFAAQFGTAKAVPVMFVTVGQAGTMYFFTAITLVGIAWVIFFLPELSGLAHHEIAAVFELPWYRIGMNKGSPIISSSPETPDSRPETRIENKAELESPSSNISNASNSPTYSRKNSPSSGAGVACEKRSTVADDGDFETMNLDK